MTSKKYKILAAALVLGTMSGIVPMASAQTAGAASSAVSPRQTARMTNLVTRANREIGRRVTRLNALAARIQSMKKLSSDEISGLTASIQGQITDLNNLKAKIDADTDLPTLRADVQSVIKTYRIYMLVIPRAAMMAAADRVMAIADIMNALSGKLQSRITAAQSSGKDVTALQSAYSDFTAKVSDASIEAQAAVNEVSGLTPDNGDTAKRQSNASALKDARSKIKTARQDLVAARKDAGTIVKGLRAMETNSSASSTSP